MLNQTCTGTGVDSDGHSYALSTNSNGDCVGVLLGGTSGLTDGGETGTMGDQTITLEQELELNQTSTGPGDRTVVIERNMERRFDENNTGPGGSGDRSISIGQNLEQRLEQTGTGGGGAEAAIVGRNTAVVKNSNNFGE